MRTFDVEQGTPEWLKVKCGRISSSRIYDVITEPKPTKSGGTRGGITELSEKRKYRGDLVAERLTGRTAEHHVSREMQHGIDSEPFAREAYGVGTEVMVDTFGFVLHPNMDFCGASPDGLVGEEGCLEIKCPTTANFLDWCDEDVVPEEHQPQMQWVMACCERAWCDFVAYDPRLPEGCRIFVKRLDRNEKQIAAMEFKSILFNEEVEAKRLRVKPGHIWCPQMPRIRSVGTAFTGTEDFIGDLMAAMDGTDATEGNLIP